MKAIRGATTVLNDTAEDIKKGAEAQVRNRNFNRRLYGRHGRKDWWERGEVIPSIEVCIKLADFFNITLDELVGRKN